MNMKSEKERSKDSVTPVAALAEVTGRLLALADSRKVKTEEHFKRMRLPVPLVRGELKKPYSFVGTSRESDLRIWDYAWNNSEWYEVMHLAVYFYQGRTITPAECVTIQSWVDRCFCWEHSDGLSKIFADALENDPDAMLPVLQRWNSAASLWKRRQSLVGLIEYASKRKRVLPVELMLPLVENLLNDEEYYVQKGLGWTLRELYTLYPEATFRFMDEHLHAISPTAYSAATAKLDKTARTEFKRRRVEYRKMKGAGRHTGTV